jgi:hypothetical protein
LEWKNGRPSEGAVHDKAWMIAASVEQSNSNLPLVAQLQQRVGYQIFSAGEKKPRPKPGFLGIEAV